MNCLKFSAIVDSLIFLSSAVLMLKNAGIGGKKPLYYSKIQIQNGLHINISDGKQKSLSWIDKVKLFS